MQRAGESIPFLSGEFAVRKLVSPAFSLQNASGNRWSFQVLWSASIYNAKYINLLLHSRGMRLKHLF